MLEALLKLAGVQAVVGADSLLAEEALERLLAEHAWATRARTRSESCGATRPPGRALLESARTGSLFAPQRAVVVRNAEQHRRARTRRSRPIWTSPTPGRAARPAGREAGQAQDARGRASWRRRRSTSAEPLKGRALRAHVQDQAAAAEAGARGRGAGGAAGARRTGPAPAGGRDRQAGGVRGGTARGRSTAEDVAAVLRPRPGRRRSTSSPTRSAARRLGRVLALMERRARGRRGAAAASWPRCTARCARCAGRGAARGARVAGRRSSARLGLLPFKVSDVLEAARRWSDPELAVSAARAGRRRPADQAGSRAAVRAAGGGGGRRRGGRRRRSAARVQRVDAAGQAALVPGRGVVVDDALLGGLVDRAHRLGQRCLRPRRRRPWRWRSAACAPGSSAATRSCGCVRCACGPASSASGPMRDEPNGLLDRCCRTCNGRQKRRLSQLTGEVNPEVAPPTSGSLARAAGLVSALTFLSRLLGLVREQVFAALLGAGMYADAFQAAFQVPNLLRDLFAEGALSAAFVPTYARAPGQGGRERAFAPGLPAADRAGRAAGRAGRGRASSSRGRSCACWRPASRACRASTRPRSR